MKFSCTRTEFIRALGIVKRGVATKSTLPVLRMVLIDTTEDGLQLSGTNLEVGIRCRMDAKVQELGSICVPANLLATILSSYSEHEITCDSSDAQILHLQCGGHKDAVRGVQGDEFPTIIVEEDDGDVSIQSGTLRDLLQTSLYAVSQDISRPVLTGLHMLLGPDGITMQAADGYRLAQVHSDSITAQDHVQVLIPRNNLVHLLALLDDEPVRFKADKLHNRAQFRLQGVDLVSQLLEGVFPDVKQLLPHESRFTTKIEVMSRDLESVCKMAAIFAADSAIRIEVNEGALRVYSTSVNLGGHESVLSVTTQGKTGFQFGINPIYLISILDAIGGDAIVEISIIDPNSPLRIRPIGNADSVHIVMPMSIAK